ncbi:hypothetical protein E4U41_000627 [Claviceps citrina]|nr:hypothetical protein E4U41_000627 [Claviceps citrina]
MDSKECIVVNLNYVLDCAPLRDLTDLGCMELATINKRVDGVKKSLPRRSIISIYIAWLQARAMHPNLEELPVEEWCQHLASRYRCSHTEVLWYWDRSTRAVWCHLPPSKQFPDVVRRIYDLRCAILMTFPDDPDAPGPRGDQGEAPSSHDSSSQCQADDLRGKPPSPASRSGFHDDGRSDKKPGMKIDSRKDSVFTLSDCGDMSHDRLADEPTGDARGPRGNSPGHTLPALYFCNMCVARGKHDASECTGQTSPSHQTTAQTKILPAGDGETSKSTLLAPQKRLQEEDIQNDASPQASGQNLDLAVRPSSAPKVPWAPNCDSTSSQPSNDDLVEWSLSLKTEHIESPTRPLHAQVTVRLSALAEHKRDEHAGRKESSAADKVALQRADEFLCRLGQALKRRYQNGREPHLIFWKNEEPSKMSSIEAANDCDRMLGRQPIVDADGASVPCPVSDATSQFPGSEDFPPVMNLWGIFFNQTVSKVTTQDIFHGLPCVAAVQEPSHSAMELWQAGIVFNAEETSNDDGSLVAEEGQETDTNSDLL